MSGFKARRDFNGSKIQKGGLQQNISLWDSDTAGGSPPANVSYQGFKGHLFNKVFPLEPRLELNLQALGIVIVFKEILYIL